MKKYKVTYWNDENMIPIKDRFENIKRLVNKIHSVKMELKNYI